MLSGLSLSQKKDKDKWLEASDRSRRQPNQSGCIEMADDPSDPLILSPIDEYTTESENPRVDKNCPSSFSSLSLDEIIERCIGGDYGWVQAAMVSFAWVFDAQQTFISVFTDAQPTWHCTTSLQDIEERSHRYYSYYCNSSSSDICKLPRNSWAWDVPTYTSTVSEWSLQCAGPIITGLPASSFFMGCVAGGFILATLADSSVGRKNTLILSCLIMSLTGLLTAFSTNIWIYSALRFACGFGRATLSTCALVLSTELVGKRHRGQVGIIGFLFFAVGFLSLPLIAYLNRGSSWRLLFIWTCTPAILYCVLVHLFVRESPRWLFVKGHKEEFLATLKSIVPPSKRSSLTNLTISWSFFSQEEEKYSRKQLQQVNLYSALKMLVGKSWALRRLSAVMVVGFGTGMVYYGMPLGVGNLAFDNLYLSVTFNALSELPASLATVFLIGRLNRKVSVLGFTLLSGVCSMMVCVVATMNKELDLAQIGLEIVSFFSACTALNVLLIYTLELFPTCVRNSAISMLRQAVVLGGAVSPLLLNQGLLVLYGVLGFTIAFCGLFVAFLPETIRGWTQCDTMDEEEHKVIANQGGAPPQSPTTTPPPAAP